MKTHRLAVPAVTALAIVLGAISLVMAAAPGYHLLKKYPFPAAPAATREYFDYVAVDSAARRVYISHGTEIIVLDADSGKTIGNITGLKQDHGVAVATELLDPVGGEPTLDESPAKPKPIRTPTPSFTIPPPSASSS